MRKAKYTIEKVLYYANQKSALHVAPDEKPRDTDLYRIVRELKKMGQLVLCGTDDSGEYYQTTKAGDVHLLKLQISWREAHGKDVTEHKQKLAELESEHAQ